MFNPFKAAMPTLLGALTVAAACIATPAHAGLMIKLQSGATTYTQSGPSPLVVVQSIGNFTTTVNTGTATLAPSLDLSSVDINSSSGGTLIVTVSADGFTAPFGAANWLSQFSGNFVFGAATVTQQTYLDNTNTLLGTGTLLSTLSASTTPFAMSQIIGCQHHRAIRINRSADNRHNRRRAFEPGCFDCECAGACFADPVGFGRDRRRDPGPPQTPGLIQLPTPASLVAALG